MRFEMTLLVLVLLGGGFGCCHPGRLPIAAAGSVVAHGATKPLGLLLVGA